MWLRTGRPSTSTWPTWSWSPCSCSRRWTCRSSRQPPSSRRHSCKSARQSWERSSPRFGIWRTTLIIFYCGSWSRRRPCFKCAADTNDSTDTVFPRWWITTLCWNCLVIECMQVSSLHGRKHIVEHFMSFCHRRCQRLLYSSLLESFKIVSCLKLLSL